ncbi:hypothetical protein MMC17_006630 [Xylographa soralifera]|nr:hypothetical protein [Xylographa soralifera]
MSEDFVESAGAIIFHLSKKQICLIRLKSRDEWLLAKGRRNCGESLSEAAVREAHEETGYSCTLLPVTMPTRAPSAVETGFVLDTACIYEGVNEPIAITIRELSGGQNIKIISWYVAAIDEQNGEEIGFGEDQFEVGFFDYEKVLKKLTFQADRDVVQRAMDIVCDKFDIAKACTSSAAATS